MATKTKKKPAKKTEQDEHLQESFVKDGRLGKIAGLLCLLISIFLFVAFGSYILTWEEDQSIFRNVDSHWGQLFNSEVNAENSLGRLGAIVSHQFFYRWFGIGSFLFIFLFFVSGFNLLFQKRTFNLSRIFKYSLVFLLWFPPAMSYLLSSFGFPFGGAYGNAVDGWLVSFMGMVGTGLFLLFYFLLFMVVFFNIEFNRKLPVFGKDKTPLEPVMTGAKLTEDKDLPKDIYERENLEYGKEEAVPVVNKEEPELELDIIEDEEKIEEPYLKPKEEPEPVAEDLSLEVEEAVEEVMDETGLGTNYDPTLDLPRYKYPTLELLEDYGDNRISIDTQELEKNKDQIISTLNNYNIQISKIKATVGPTVTLYEIVPAPGVRISKIKNLEDDIALSLAALGIRIIAPIPGKGTIGIEVPNVKKEIVAMRTLLASEKFTKADMDLPIALGKNIANENYIADLAKMPHLLMAGATGQGKSVGINAILISLLYKKHPSQLKFVLIDPKKVELSLFKMIEKHFLAKLPGEEEAIITDTKKVVNTLNALCIEMDDRYNLLKEAQVRNIKEYNEKFMSRKLNPEKGHKFLPFIVLIVDEFADLMMTAGKEVEQPIARLAQLARAIGIHLVVATQRPSVNIITGTIKANFPARVAFKVTSKVDSRTILDTGGADQLIGRGDMLLSLGGHITRLQCAFVDTHEVEHVTEFIGAQMGYEDAYMLPEFYGDDEAGQAASMDLGDRDDMFEEAARVIVQHQQGSTSLIQRRLKLGYNRAGRIMDQLEAAGIVGPNQGSKAREVLFSTEYELEQFLKNNE